MSDPGEPTPSPSPWRRALGALGTGVGVVVAVLVGLALVAVVTAVLVPKALRLRDTTRLEPGATVPGARSRYLLAVPVNSDWRLSTKPDAAVDRRLLWGDGDAELTVTVTPFQVRGDPERMDRAAEDGLRPLAERPGAVKVVSSALTTDFDGGRIAQYRVPRADGLIEEHIGLFFFDEQHVYALMGRARASAGMQAVMRLALSFDVPRTPVERARSVFRRRLGERLTTRPALREALRASKQEPTAFGDALAERQLPRLDDMLLGRRMALRHALLEKAPDPVCAALARGTLAAERLDEVLARLDMPGLASWMDISLEAITSDEPPVAATPWPAYAKEQALLADPSASDADLCAAERTLDQAAFAATGAERLALLRILAAAPTAAAR